MTVMTSKKVFLLGLPYGAIVLHTGRTVATT